MSRYIDADALKAYYVDLSTEKDIGYGDMGRMITVNINHIIKTIDEAPSIDIVRCKECKWRNEYGCHNPIWGDGWANYPSPNPRADDFCSYGERREP